MLDYDIDDVQHPQGYRAISYAAWPDTKLNAELEAICEQLEEDLVSLDQDTLDELEFKRGAILGEMETRERETREREAIVNAPHNRCPECGKSAIEKEPDGDRVWTVGDQFTCCD